MKMYIYNIYGIYISGLDDINIIFRLKPCQVHSTNIDKTYCFRIHFHSVQTNSTFQKKTRHYLILLLLRIYCLKKNVYIVASVVNTSVESVFITLK